MPKAATAEFADDRRRVRRRRHATRQKMDAGERLDHGVFIKRPLEPGRPVVGGEDNVGIEPDDGTARLRQRLEGKVEKPLLLPHDVGAATLHKELGVIRPKIETIAVGELNRYQRNAQSPPEGIVICTPDGGLQRVEVAGDAPERVAADRILLHARCLTTLPGQRRVLSALRTRLTPSAKGMSKT